MPDDLPGYFVKLYRSKIPAVGAFHLRAAHVESNPVIQHPVDTLDQYAVTRLLKDDHIPGFNPAGWKGNLRRKDELAFTKIGMKAVSLDFVQSQHLIIERAEQRLL